MKRVSCKLRMFPQHMSNLKLIARHLHNGRLLVSLDRMGYYPERVTLQCDY